MEITVSKKDSEFKFHADRGERVLYAGLRQGLALPHECATGTCGTCKAILKSGQLENLWGGAAGGRKLKADKKEFLMCQNAALMDCEIAFRGQLAKQQTTSNLPAYYKGSIIESGYLTRDMIRLVVEFEQPVTFNPGQFVVFNVDAVEGGRAYSMVNIVDGSSTLEFIVKQLPGGKFSEWLFSESRIQSEISIFGPLGSATLRPDDNKNILCITGGSGIAGIVSLLSQAVKNGYFAKTKGHCFFGVKSYQDLFFQNRLAALVEKSNRKLAVTITISMGALPKLSTDHKGYINYVEGDVTPVAMQQMEDNLIDTIAFLAGPPAMVDDAIRRLVIDAGFPANEIRYDKFG